MTGAVQMQKSKWEDNYHAFKLLQSENEWLGILQAVHDTFSLEREAKIVSC